MKPKQMKCDQLLPYYLHELTPVEEAHYELHLEHCLKCKAEAEQLQIGMLTLANTIEMKEPPADLKADVLSFLYKEEKKTDHAMNANVITVSTKRSIMKWIRLQFTPVSAACVVVLMLLTVSSVWKGFYPDAQSTVQNTVITKQLDYTPIAEDSRGIVTISHEDGKTICYVTVGNLDQTIGDEVYQVWLLKDAKRYSAGTFIVDNEGNGMLVYEVREGFQFDGIGITLEPDALGKQPRGKKVLGIAL